MTEDANDPTSEADEGLLAAITSLIEFLIARNVATPEELASVFNYQRNRFEGLGMPVAGYVLERLQKFAADPQRANARQTLARLLAEPPQGPEGKQ